MRLLSSKEILKIASESQIFERVWKVATEQGIGTYTDLARHMHTTSATVSRLATGKQRWTSKMLVAAANALRVSRKWLETGAVEEDVTGSREAATEYSASPANQGLAPIDVVVAGQKLRAYIDPGQLRAILRQSEDEKPAQS